MICHRSFSNPLKHNYDRANFNLVGQIYCSYISNGEANDNYVTYAHKIHLFILQYVSPSLFKILDIYKLHEIAYEKLHK